MALTELPSEETLKVLALDTSSMTGSVALCHGGIVLAESLVNIRNTHSERLLFQIEHVLEMADVAITDLDLFAVVHGPGSFTGLRVGLATAKGLATACGIPVVGVSTLEVLAMNLPFCPHPVCAFLDARKQEVYSCLFDCRDGFPVAIGNESVLPPRDLLQQLDGAVTLVGDGVFLYRAIIDECLGPLVKLPPAIFHQPRAAAVAALAGRKYANGQLVADGSLVPSYIRPSDADLPKSKSETKSF